MDMQTVAHVMALARLKTDHVEKLKEDLEGILAFVGELASVDTRGVRPLINVSTDTLTPDLDQVKDGGYPELILSNAPESNRDLFAVPKVLE